MKNDCMLYFSNPKQVIDYINRFEVYRNWKIQNGLMNHRGHLVMDSDFFVEVTKLFELKGMFLFIIWLVITFEN